MERSHDEVPTHRAQNSGRPLEARTRTLLRLNSHRRQRARARYRLGLHKKTRQRNRMLLNFVVMCSDSLHGALPTDRTIQCSKPLDVARAWARALTTPRGAAGATSMRHRWRGVSLAVGTVRHWRRLPETQGERLAGEVLGWDAVTVGRTA